MSYEEREKIFSKEVITINELALLLDTQYQVAQRVMLQIKRKCDRLGIQGKLHIEDYFEYYGITDKQRYIRGNENA